MSDLQRFGVSMDAELLAAFDQLIDRKGYANRSEALRDLVRDALVRTQWAARDEPTMAALCMVYDHHTRELAARLTGIQHDHAGFVVSTLHVHLDHRYCLEIVVLKGRAGELQDFADRMLATKGVKHGQLVFTATAEGLD